MIDALWRWSWEPKIKGRAYQTSFSWKFYGPAEAAITRVWFGRDAYDYYCYSICHMGLLMPMEPSDDYR
ncbi:MAG: hypothetical protein ACXWDN_12885 [Limisphaerales bacterium]